MELAAERRCSVAKVGEPVSGAGWGLGEPASVIPDPDFDMALGQGERDPDILGGSMAADIMERLLQPEQDIAMKRR